MPELRCSGMAAFGTAADFTAHGQSQTHRGGAKSCSPIAPEIQTRIDFCDSRAGLCCDFGNTTTQLVLQIWSLRRFVRDRLKVFHRTRAFPLQWGGHGRVEPHLRSIFESTDGNSGRAGTQSVSRHQPVPLTSRRQQRPREPHTSSSARCSAIGRRVAPKIRRNARASTRTTSASASSSSNEVDATARAWRSLPVRGADLFEAIQVDAPFDQHWLFIGSVPHLYPLGRLIDTYPRYAAVMLDTNKARIFVFGLGRHRARGDRSRTRRRAAPRRAAGRRPAISVAPTTFTCTTSRKWSRRSTRWSATRTSSTSSSPAKRWRCRSSASSCRSSSPTSWSTCSRWDRTAGEDEDPRGDARRAAREGRRDRCRKGRES